jgi:Helix-turn-helix domain
MRAGLKHPTEGREACCLDNSSLPHLRPNLQAPCLPRVFVCPRLTLPGLGTTEEIRALTIREKLFGPGRAVPLDRNAKARIMAYARAWGARHKQPGQHRGPITRAFLEVLGALLWGFHNGRDGRCFPSYETIAAKAECCRDTVCEALKVLELADVLTWDHRIARIQVRERDLFGHSATRWRVIRTSNAYVFRDPQPRLVGVPTSKSENQAGTRSQEIQILTAASADPDNPLEAALKRLGASIEGRLLSNASSGQVLAI